MAQAAQQVPPKWPLRPSDRAQAVTSGKAIKSAGQQANDARIAMLEATHIASRIGGNAGYWRQPSQSDGNGNGPHGHVGPVHRR
jgi:hypothetical protein